MILKDNTIVRDIKAIGAAHVFSSSVLTDEKCEFAVQFQNLDVYTGIGVADQELSTEGIYWRNRCTQEDMLLQEWINLKY